MTHEIDQELIKIAGRVGKGKKVRRTARDFLELFGAQRRGARILTEIEARLAKHKLRTEPSIVDVHIDEVVVFESIAEQPQHIEKMQEADRRLKEGEEPIAVTVRELMRWFGWVKRGTKASDFINASLAGFDLDTEPDFESTHFDGEVEIVRAGRAPEQEPVHVEEIVPVEEGTIPPPIRETEDTAFRVGTLAEAHREVVRCDPSMTLREAVSIMSFQQISYLPVLVGDRKVIGVIRWKDVGKFLLHGKGLDAPASDAASRACEVSVNDPFLRIIGDVIQHGCVLVRDTKRLISGIITKKDLGRRLQELAGPFVTLGEIERCLRALAEKGDFTGDELRELAVDPTSPREVNSVADLTLGEFQRLFERPEAWARLEIPFPKKTFVLALQEVRLVRNNIMHFEPESPTDDDRKTLKKFSDMVYELAKYA